jgi:hypothetical protein
MNTVRTEIRVRRTSRIVWLALRLAIGLALCLGFLYNRAQAGWPPTWSAHVNVSNSAGASYQPKILWGAGSVVIFYVDNSEPPYSMRLYYRTAHVNGILGERTPTPLYTGIYDAEIDANGGLHALSSDGWYTFRSVNGLWSTPVSTGLLERGYSYDLHISPNGHAFVVTDEGEVFEQKVDGAWQALPAPFVSAIRCRHAVDHADTLHMACEVDGQVLYVSKSAADNWGDVISLSESDLGAFDPQLAIDGEGRVHVVYRERIGFAEFQLQHRILTNGQWTVSLHPPGAYDAQFASSSDALFLRGEEFAVWTAKAGWRIESPPPAPKGSDGSDMKQSGMWISGDGSVHLLWLDCSRGGCFSTSKDPFEHVWRSPQGLWYGPTHMEVAATPYGGGLSAAGGKDSNLHVAWFADGEIWMSTFSEHSNISLHLPEIAR